MREVTGGNLEDEIRQSRAENCYTQAYMANQLGVTQSTYYKIESGKLKISMERLNQIAEILGKPITAFLEKEEYEEQLKNEKQNKDNEFELLQKTILKLENQVTELKAKIQRRDKKIEELKLKLAG